MFVMLPMCYLLLYLMAEGAPTVPACTTGCVNGQYCSGNNCLPCPPRTYRSDALHTFTNCTLWTVKPPNSHYVIVTNGTNSSDVEYSCKDGYVKREYTRGNFECVEMSTTVPSTITTEVTSTNNTTLSELEITTETPTSPKGKETNYWLEICLPITVCLTICGGLIAFICWMKRRRNLNRDNQCGGDGRDTTNQPLVPNPMHGIYYRFFEVIVKRLGASLTIKFIRSLDDPSGQFSADKTIDSDRISEMNLIKCLENWAFLNNGIDRIIIERVLEFVGKPSLLEHIEIPENTFDSDHVHLNGEAVRYTNPSDYGDGARSLEAEPRFDSPAVYRICYFLFSKLGVDTQPFLDLLPDAIHGFNAREYYRTNGGSIDDENHFALALHEYWQSDQAHVITNIESVLKNRERIDILEDNEFQNLCSVATGTCQH